MMRPPLVTLEPWQVKFADSVARRRQDAAERRRRQSVNGGASEGEEAFYNHILGCRGEAACKLWLNPISWQAYAERISNLPDLGDFIDVKAVENPKHRLLVQAEAKTHWAYVLALGHRHPRWEMVGWCWGSEAKKREYWRDPKGGRPAYFVPRERLRPISELWAIVRGDDA